jgi:hypothetical protein
MFLTKISTQMNKEPKKEKSMTSIKINNSYLFSSDIIPVLVPFQVLAE